MKKIMLFVLALLLLAPFYASADTIDFTFEGVAADGTGLATMAVDFNDLATVMTATLENTSPITTNTAPVSDNIPGIVGFGFTFDDMASLPGVTDWSLSAYKIDPLTGISELVCLGGSCPSSTSLGLWKVDDNVTYQGTYLDYLANNMGAGSHVALYNPDVYSIVNATNNPYFTQASLMITFATPVDYESAFGAYVRMQRVGTNTAGSLKLWGEEDMHGQEIPEPSTLILVGVGIAGLLAYRRKEY